MSITKSEAIIMLAMSTGNSDGEFSFKEIEDAITKTPALREAMKEAESTDWLSKFRTKELNSESAMKALSKLSIEDKTEAMAICWGIIMSDGNVSYSEKNLIEKWTEELGIKLEDVKAKHEQMYQ